MKRHDTLPFSKDAKGRRKKHPRSDRKLLNGVKYLLRTNKPWVDEVLDEELRFLRHYLRLKSWYGSTRIQLTDYEILFDGKAIVKSKIPRILSSYGLRIPKGS